MKKSISVWSFYGDWDLEAQMKLARDSGFQGIEVEISKDGPISLDSNRDDHLRVRDMADSIGIEISGLATGLYWEFNAASNDSAIQEGAKKVLEKQITVASDLGVDTILVVPATVGADFIPNCEVIPYDVAWARATEFIKTYISLAEEKQVTMGIENVWNKFLLSPLEMRRFIDQFQSDYVGSYFDAGNCLQNGYPEHWISILGERIKRVHFKDYRRNVGTVDGFVDLLSGDINWPEVIAALKAAGYSNWVAAEMIPPVPFYKFSPETLITNTSSAMDALLKMGDS